MSEELFHVRRLDGGLIEGRHVGPADGRTVVLHHGTPGSALLAREFAGVAEAHGLFVVALSRPGYAGSTRRAGRAVADVVDDVRLALDHLGRDRYASVGWSGGGPHALAGAARDAERCVGAWSLAGVAPYGADFDWTAGMAEENVEEFRLALEGGPAYEEALATAAAALGEATPENVVDLFGGLLSAADLEVFDEDGRAWWSQLVRDAVAGGWLGFHDDDQAFLAPWGFDPATIERPVTIWYGDEDRMVPPTHGAWLGTTIPGARVRHRPDEGHVSLVARHRDEIAAELAAAFD